MRWKKWFLLPSVSFLLHLAVFWPSPEIRSVDAVRPAISARILLPASTSVVPTAPAIDDVQGTRPEFSRQPKPASDAGVARADKRSTGGPTLRHVAEFESLPSTFEVAAGSRIDPSVATEQPIRTDSAPSELGSIARYRLALAAAAIRMQSDIKSEEDALRGTVVVEVSFLGASTVPQVTLSRSSGIERLDTEAVALLARAASAVAVARPMADFSLRLPVVFELTEP